MALAESIFAKFNSDAALSAILGAGDTCRVFPDSAPFGTPTDYVVWQEVATVPDVTLGEASASGLRMVQFSCIADTYKRARDLAAAIIAALDNATLDGGVVCLSCSEQDGYSESTDQFLRIVEATFFAAPAPVA